MSTYSIKSVSESPAGISVSILIGTADNFEVAEYLISREFWYWGRLQNGSDISEEEYLGMDRSASLSRAIARMKGILSYSGVSRRTLIQKLKGYDFSEEICVCAADYAVDHGMVREDVQVEHAIDTYLHRKYWGRRRITAELSAKGYPREVIDNALAQIPEEDFMRALHVILVKKYGEIPADPQEKQKMILSLLRMGYSGNEIKDALASFADAE
ncbi:MAG: regulatory protein RecX [Clostridia bacterium]|nr:regulatory protein RecX [Clostridia bacterium]